MSSNNTRTKGDCQYSSSNKCTGNESSLLILPFLRFICSSIDYNYLSYWSSYDSSSVYYKFCDEEFSWCDSLSCFKASYEGKSRPIKPTRQKDKRRYWILSRLVVTQAQVGKFLLLLFDSTLYICSMFRDYCDYKGWEQPVISTLGEHGIPALSR